LGLVSEKIDFFWPGQRKNRLFWAGQRTKSVCLWLVNEKVDFFRAGQRKKHLFVGLVSEKIIFFGVRALIRAFFLGGPLPSCLIDWN
jgi:hypothetical protein